MKLTITLKTQRQISPTTRLYVRFLLHLKLWFESGWGGFEVAPHLLLAWRYSMVRESRLQRSVPVSASEHFVLRNWQLVRGSSYVHLDSCGVPRGESYPHLPESDFDSRPLRKRLQESTCLWYYGHRLWSPLLPPARLRSSRSLDSNVNMRL